MSQREVAEVDGGASALEQVDEQKVTTALAGHLAAGVDALGHARRLLGDLFKDATCEDVSIRIGCRKELLDRIDKYAELFLYAKQAGALASILRGLDPQTIAALKELVAAVKREQNAPVIDAQAKVG